MMDDIDKTANGRVISVRLFSIKKRMDAFILDGRIRNLSSDTIDYYKRQLENFEIFAGEHNVRLVRQITADLLRAYVLHLEANGHNIGGVRAKFRALRVFLKWYENQAEPKDWQNPIKKVSLPKETSAPIIGVIMADIRAVIATCKGDFLGTRDKAMMLCLLDTAAGAEELLNMDLNDIDLTNGSVVIRKGKRRKAQTISIEPKSRQALRDYLRFRPDQSPAVWVTTSGHRLAVKSLLRMLAWRGKMAGVHPPSINDFKRASRQNRADLQKGHEKASHAKKGS